MAEAPADDAGCQLIRDWMKAKGFFDTIIEEVFTEKGIADTDGLILVTESGWSEIVRLCLVAQRAEESDTAAEKAMENKLNKIEKEWRKLANLPKGAQPSGDSPADRTDESSRAERDEALEKGKDLKAFLKKEGCMDLDMLVVLVKNGVVNEDGLSTLDTVTKWDEVVRQTKLMRGAVDREDMINLEKKLAKVEKIWRTKTGISVRSTDFKGASDASERKRADESSAVVRDEALAKGAEIKAFLKKNGCLDIDFVVVLVRHDVVSEADITKIDSQRVWDDIVRETKIERGSSDREEEMRLENNLAKFEKIWRTKTGIKKGPSGGGSKKKKGAAGDGGDERKDESSAAAREELMKKGNNMKQFLKKNQCLNIDFLCVLVEADVCAEDDIPKIDSNKKWDEICRKTRVARGTTDATELAKVDATLSKFEKLWRGKTGIKKPIGTTGKKKKTPSRKSSAASPSGAAGSEGAELKAWMRKNQIFEQLLLDELVKLGCKGPADFKNVGQSDFDNALRAVRVAKRAETKDHAAMTRLDKKLNAFEKLWKAESGGSAAAGGKKKKKKKAAAS